MTMPYYSDDSVTLYHGDALEVLRRLPDESVDCCVTSPPYFGLRDYGVAGQYGLEASPDAYVGVMRELFAQVRRVLVSDGTLWLNLGDSYSAKRSYQVNQTKVQSSGKSQPYDTLADRPAKNLLGVPWRVAFALQDDGWILRNDIIWAKPNGKPESVTDRLSTKHEHVFLFSKSPRYWFDLDAVREPTGAGGDGHVNGKNPGDVWSIATQPFSSAHFAVMPPKLADRCVQAGCKPGGTVLDPFSGSGTTGLAAARHGRGYVGIDISADYLRLSLVTRLAQSALDFGESA
jgi:DNA modification methylase